VRLGPHPSPGLMKMSGLSSPLLCCAAREGLSASTDEGRNRAPSGESIRAMVAKIRIRTSQLTTQHNVLIGCTQFYIPFLQKGRIIKVAERVEGVRPRVNKLDAIASWCDRSRSRAASFTVRNRCKWSNRAHQLASASERLISEGRVVLGPPSSVLPTPSTLPCGSLQLDI